MTSGNNMEFINEDFNKICRTIIQREVDSFFSACMKAAYTFSLLISENIERYSYEAFERMVLSDDELDQVKQGIISRLNIELKNQSSPFRIGDYNRIERSYIEGTQIFTRTMNSFKSTLHVTSFCQKAIDKSFSAFMKKNLPNPLLCKAAGKVKLGERLLGDYSLKGQVKRHQQLIYDQVVGMLTNIKVCFKNDVEEIVEKNLEIVNLRDYNIA